jgi:hypothetical protein
VTAWPRRDAEAAAFGSAWTTTARRVHAIEQAWFERVRTATVYRYDLPAAAFSPWPEASGQWIAEEPVEPITVRPLTDLVGRHVAAGIELRIVPSLWPLHDLARRGPWDFSIVRMVNARPR